MAGVDADGFDRKRLDTILDDLNTGLQAIFGQNLNVSPESPDGQMNGLFAGSLADLWEIAESAYNAFNPSATTGNSLSNLVQLNGILRQAATFSTGTVNVTGVNGTVIPSGSFISTGDGLQFSTDTLITITAGVGSSDVTAVLSGPITANIATLTNIDTPIAGWTTVTNPAIVEGGVDEETDSELRSRRVLSVSLTAQMLFDSILAEILAVENVVTARIQENATALTAGGLVPHSFMAVVDGGADQDIGEAIFNKAPIGIATNGAVNVTVTDRHTFEHTVLFERPTLITIYVKVTLFTGTSYAGDTAVKQNIIDFANGDLLEGRGFNVGDDVIYSEMYVPVNDTALGIDQVTEILIDTVSPPTSEVTISIDPDEKANFLIGNITIVQGT